MNQPAKLYHASDKRGIKAFEPRRETFRGKTEGLVVFATPDKVYASMFIVEANDSWTRRGRFDGGDWFMVIADEERFNQNDSGGAIYTLSGETFSSDPNRNMHGTEWVSVVPVPVVEEDDFDSGLEAMRSLGVDVYFVTAKIFGKIQNSPDHGRQILAELAKKA